MQALEDVRQWWISEGGADEWEDNREFSMAQLNGRDPFTLVRDRLERELGLRP